MALAFRKFDPYAFLQNEAGAGTPAKPARPAKDTESAVSFSAPSNFSIGGRFNCKKKSPNFPAAEVGFETSATLHPAIALPGCVAEFPHEWRHGLSKLEAMSCPYRFKSSRWTLLTRDARRFIDEWASQCASLGWTTLDVFGVNPQSPDNRHDGKGLVILLGGHQLISIEPDKATVKSPSTGNILRIYRRRTPEQIAVWDL